MFPATDTTSVRILVVDDDDQLRSYLRRLLGRTDYQVEEAATADEAIERVRANPPDLVVLDLQLPDRSGLEVLEFIRSEPTTRLLPVVMLTGAASPAGSRRGWACLARIGGPSRWPIPHG